MKRIFCTATVSLVALLVLVPAAFAQGNTIEQTGPGQGNSLEQQSGQPGTSLEQQGGGTGVRRR